MSLDCMLNRVLLVTRFDDPVTKEWAADGLLRVKYVISDDRFYPAGNLFVLVLKKKSDSYGYIVFYKWNRKTRHESFSLENDSLVHKGRRGWDAKAPLGGVGTLEYFNQTLRRMAKMPVIEIPVQDVTRTGASCTYYGQLPPGEN